MPLPSQRCTPSCGDVRGLHVEGESSSHTEGPGVCWWAQAPLLPCLRVPQMTGCGRARSPSVLGCGTWVGSERDQRLSLGHAVTTPTPPRAVQLSHSDASAQRASRGACCAISWTMYGHPNPTLHRKLAEQDWDPVTQVSRPSWELGERLRGVKTQDEPF